MADLTVAESLKEIVLKVASIEKRNKQLEEENRRLNLENWELTQKNEKLEKEVERWKSVSFGVK